MSQIKTDGNTSIIRGEQRNNRNTELLQKQALTNIETDYIVFDINCLTPDI